MDGMGNYSLGSRTQSCNPSIFFSCYVSFRKGIGFPGGFFYQGVYFCSLTLGWGYRSKVTPSSLEVWFDPLEWNRLAGQHVTGTWEFFPVFFPWNSWNEHVLEKLIEGASCWLLNPSIKPNLVLLKLSLMQGWVKYIHVGLVSKYDREVLRLFILMQWVHFGPYFVWSCGLTGRPLVGNERISTYSSNHLQVLKMVLLRELLKQWDYEAWQMWIHIDTHFLFCPAIWKLRSKVIVTIDDIAYVKTYCWWKKSCTTWDVKKLANNEIFTISTGAGFLPSTVL